MKSIKFSTMAIALFTMATMNLYFVSAKQCGRQPGGPLCPGGLCCSKWGWCGNTEGHCRQDCQSQCGGSTPSPTPVGQGVASIISESIFNELLKHRNDAGCKANGFYTYSAFIAAANAFSGFGTTGDLDTRKRELAAFFGQTSHETTGGWATAPDGTYAWGYCFREEQGNPPAEYCKATAEWPCASGKRYYGRGPVQLSWNYNYGIANDATVSFKTAVWFWMTAQSPKPSCHDVMTGRWSPSGSDSAAGRAAGYGVVTNIINGGLECGKGSDSRQQDRIGFYKRYCDILGVSYGSNLDCNNQSPFGSAVKSEPRLIKTVV